MNTLSKNLVKIQENIDTLLEKLTDAENKYYKQFAALETAMSKLNSQQAWLTQQFSSSNGRIEKSSSTSRLMFFIRYSFQAQIFGEI